MTTRALEAEGRLQTLEDEALCLELSVRGMYDREGRVGAPRGVIRTQSLPAVSDATRRRYASFAERIAALPWPPVQTLSWAEWFSAQRDAYDEEALSEASEETWDGESVSSATTFQSAASHLSVQDLLSEDTQSTAVPP